METEKGDGNVGHRDTEQHDSFLFAVPKLSALTKLLLKQTLLQPPLLLSVSDSSADRLSAATQKRSSVFLSLLWISWFGYSPNMRKEKRAWETSSNPAQFHFLSSKHTDNSWEKLAWLSTCCSLEVVWNLSEVTLNSNIRKVWGKGTSDTVRWSNKHFVCLQP